MSSETLIRGLRETWYLLVLVLLLGGGAMYMAVRTPSSDDNVAEASQTHSSRGVITTTRSEQTIPSRTSTREQAKTTIAAYEKRYAASTDSAEKEALLEGMGNMARQRLRDFDEAARYYSLLIGRNPNKPGIENTYANLASCYEQAGNRAKAIDLYREMKHKFPAGSEPYLFAMSKLKP
jgi:pentatricopeptide repeat protein